MVSAKELNPTAMGSIQPGDPPKTRRGRDAGYQEPKNSSRSAGEGASGDGARVRKQMRRHERATLNHAVTLELVFQTPSAGGNFFTKVRKGADCIPGNGKRLRGGPAAGVRPEGGPKESGS